MKAPHPPRSLQDAAFQFESRRHIQRVKAIKGMSAQLAMLDAHLPALEKAGIRLLEWAQSITWDRFDKALEIGGGDYFGGLTKVHGALLGVGFKEVLRNDHGSFASVILSKGRLRVTFNLWHKTPSHFATDVAPKEKSNEIPTPA